MPKAKRPLQGNLRVSLREYAAGLAKRISKAKGGAACRLHGATDMAGWIVFCYDLRIIPESLDPLRERARRVAEMIAARPEAADAAIRVSIRTAGLGGGATFCWLTHEINFKGEHFSYPNPDWRDMGALQRQAREILAACERAEAEKGKS